MRIAVMTGGGDVPGLNACIRSVVLNARDHGHETIGIRRGWAGMVAAARSDDPWAEQHFLPLGTREVRGIERRGGTILHTSRFDPTSDDGDNTQPILDCLTRHGIDALVTLGGDGTLRSSVHFSKLGVPIVACPKTMDNDVWGTDYCIGFSTAVTRSVEAIGRLRTTVASHERIGIVELFGRRSGETALLAGFLGQVDRTAIAEVPIDPARLFPLLEEDRSDNPENYAIMVVSEGASILGEPAVDDLDASGSARARAGVGRRLARLVEEQSGRGTIVQELAYLMRAGTPDALDRMVGFAFGALAIQLLDEGRHGRLVGLIDGNYGHQPIEVVMTGARRVDVDRLFDPTRYRPRLNRVEGLPMFIY